MSREPGQADALLVDAYLDIDHGIAWDAIQSDLGDLRALAAIAAKKL